MSDLSSSTVSDVTVMGGGLAGKAASLHLARAGLKVVCIEPVETMARRWGSRSTGQLPIC